jgi:hypothetical protein
MYRQTVPIGVTRRIASLSCKHLNHAFNRTPIRTLSASVFFFSLSISLSSLLTFVLAKRGDNGVVDG